MQDALLKAYERELGYFRDASLDFAQAHPAIARHLGIEADAAVDPFVERLLEGAAFLAARVQLRLDRSVDHFSATLLEQLLPTAASPVPSTAIVQFDPGKAMEAMNTPVTVSRGSTLRLVSNSARARPLFLRTTQSMSLKPMTLDAIDVLEGAAALHAAGIKAEAGRGAAGAFRLSWRIVDAAARAPLDLDEVTLFFGGMGHSPYRVLATLMTQTQRFVVTRTGSGKREVVASLAPSEVFALPALDSESALLMDGETSLYSGFRLLKEFFLLPERLRLLKVRLGLQLPPSERVEMFVVLDRLAPSLAADLEQTRVLPYCVPVVNLVPRQLDRANIDSARGEARLVVDRTRATDYEVVRVTGGKAFSAAHPRGVAMQPIFSEWTSNDVAADESKTLHYSLRRELTQLRDGTGASVNVYQPSEVWMTATAARSPDVGDYTQLAATALVSNRERCFEAVRAAGGYTLACEDPLPVDEVRFLVMPTPPEPAPTANESPWLLLGALRLNFFSLFSETDSAQAVEKFRSMLRLFADPANRFAASIIGGIVGISVSTIVERLPGQGPLSFARGAEVVVDVDQQLAESGQYVVLGAILDVFLAGYASLNSFTRLTLRDTYRHVLHRWPARLGLHECL